MNTVPRIELEITYTVAEYKTWLEAVNSKEFKNGY